MEKRKERYNELVMMRMERYRERWQIIKQYRYEAIGQAYREHGNIMNQYHCGKGTGSLGPHPNNNEAKERELIEKEMRRLKILTVSNTEL